MNKNQSNSPTDQMNNINVNNGNFDNETKHNSNKMDQINEKSGNSSIQENVYLNEIKNLKECMNRFKQLEVDEPEFACLKALALLRPDCKGLEDSNRVESMQDQAQLMLIQHERLKNPTRFGKLLFLLASLRVFSSENIRKIYFQKTIGNSSIDDLLFDMFNVN